MKTKLILLITLMIFILIFSVMGFFYLANYNNGQILAHIYAPLTEQNIKRILPNIALQIEEYRTANNVYPESLEELPTSQNIFEQPIDLFSVKQNKPTYFQYQVINDGRNYHLYSAGVDLIPSTKDDIIMKTIPNSPGYIGITNLTE